MSLLNTETVSIKHVTTFFAYTSDTSLVFTENMTRILRSSALSYHFALGYSRHSVGASTQQ